MINTDTYILPGMFFTCLCHLNFMHTKRVTPVSSIPSDHVFMYGTEGIMFFSVCWSVVVVVVVVFTLNRSFYPTTSAVPPAFLILHPREIPGTNFVVRQ